MTNELEKRAKEYAEAMAGKRPEIDSEVAFPISFLGLWLRDVRWLEEGYIAGAKAERERILDRLEKTTINIDDKDCGNPYDAAYETMHSMGMEFRRIVKGEA